MRASQPVARFSSSTGTIVHGSRYSKPALPPVSFSLPFQMISRRLRELFFRHLFLLTIPGTGGEGAKTTLLEADRVLRRSRSQSDGRMAQAGLYYTALPIERGWADQ